MGALDEAYGVFLIFPTLISKRSEVSGLHFTLIFMTKEEDGSQIKILSIV